MSHLQLPALSVEAKAELVTNNLPAFEKAFHENIEKLKYELLTDDDFAKAKDDIKALKEAESNLKAVDQAIIDGSLDVKTLRESIITLMGEARNLRLLREKEIKKRDTEIKAKIIDDALELIDHVKRENYRADVTEGTKRKRSYKAMAKGANKVSQGINDLILKTRDMLDQFANEHGNMLIPDQLDLELKDAETVAENLRYRLEKKKDEDEKARLQKEADEARKAAEDLAKANQEQNKTNLSVVENPHEINDSSSLGNVATPQDKMPEPPKVSAIPVSNSSKEETSEEEMRRFISLVESAFAPVKEARVQLRCVENIKTAGEFAKSLGAAWATFKNQSS